MVAFRSSYHGRSDDRHKIPYGEIFVLYVLFVYSVVACGYFIAAKILTPEYAQAVPRHPAHVRPSAPVSASSC
ncbi:hypothetical protein Tco_1121179 [Tanacetum coccineum]|uniref:Uncharacterized protein n=1 Tax=Tanacetum coccineum TaxID=301880 RepID=A0ABQ5IWZ1_9ASTR